MRILLCLATLLLLAPPAWADRREEIRASLAAARRAGARRASLNRVYYYWKLRTGQVGSSVTEKNQKKSKAKTKLVKHRSKRKKPQVRPRKVLKRKASRKQIKRRTPKKKTRSVLGSVAAGLQVDDPAAIPPPAEPGAGKKQEQDDGKRKKSKLRRKEPAPKTDNTDQLKRMPIKP
jgi:hypothetical protein